MLLGLCGFAGSGKDTTANVLVSDYGFHKTSFASILKDVASVMFSWPRHLLEGDTEESRKFRETPDKFWTIKFGYDFTPRMALTRLGTEVVRNTFHQSFWIYALEKRMLDMAKDIVITDVRFPNEVQFVKARGGYVARVIRGLDPEWYDDAWYANTTDKEWERPEHVHLSECAWIGTAFDYVIDNNGSLSDIKPNLEHMMKVFTGPVEQLSLTG